MKKGIKVVFRADASVEIGIGHVMRCLTLADALRQRGHQVEFACLPLPGNSMELIREKGYLCHCLAQMQAVIPSDGDWLVVDHYQLAAEWEASMRSKFRHIMVIDDLANRQHDCECLLDQNDYFQNAARYERLTPQACRFFLGPQYALLRQEFFRSRQTLKDRQGKRVRNVMISFGGTDPLGLTWKFLHWWRQASWVKESGLRLHIVIGGSSSNREEIEAYCKTQPDIALHVQTKQMARLLAEADVALGAGGVSLWERCYLSLPSVTIVAAENQRSIAEQAARDGLTLLADTSEADFLETATQELRRLVEDAALRQSMVGKMQLLYPAGQETGIFQLVEFMEGDSHDA